MTDFLKSMREANKCIVTFFGTLFMFLVIDSIIEGEYTIVYIIFSVIFCLCIICLYVTYDKDKIINKIGDENEDESENKNNINDEEKLEYTGEEILYNKINKNNIVNTI